MRIPAALAALLVTLIGGVVAITGELTMAHPLHQAIVIVAAFVAGVIGLFTTPPASSSAERAPPFGIPEPLPVPATAPSGAPSASQRPTTTATPAGRPDIPHAAGEPGVS